MRYFLFFLSLSILATSCKPPLPVYFDKPIGIQVQSFDTLIAGNYIPLDDVIDKGTKEFSEKYKIKYDKILSVKADTAFSIDVNGKEMNYEEVKDILGVKKDSGKIELKAQNCDSIFHSLCSFNELISAKLTSDIDKKNPSKPVAGIIKISYDRVFFISVDSLGNNMRDTLLTLSSKITLTKYSGKYFLNFKTPYGWEIMQLDIWENKFLSVRPFYFTGYDDCAQNISQLTASTKSIYPNLSPIQNSEKKVIGFKAMLNPRMLLDKFKNSEELILLLKTK